MDIGLSFEIGLSMVLLAIFHFTESHRTRRAES
jgi:hypothetical protein